MGTGSERQKHSGIKGINEYVQILYRELQFECDEIGNEGVK